MILMQSADAVSGSFYNLWYTVALYLPRIFAAAAMFVIGLMIATILYHVVIQVVKTLRIKEALERAGMHEAAQEAGITLDIGKFLATLVMWFVGLVFVVASLEILGLTTVTVFLERVVLLYVPQVIIASVIIIVGAIIAEAIRALVVSSARATGVHTANLAGTVAKWAIWIFAIMAALNQLGIASTFIVTIFTGIVAGLSLAFGLAFGLGGKDAAARTIEHIREEVRHSRE